MYISGMSGEIHITVGEALTHQQWRDLIVGIRTDYARIGPQKSAVLQSLEKFVIFQNKFGAGCRHAPRPRSRPSHG
ncbi:hypothetical protein FJW08_25110 [Mesorhizobium sp. B3-2-1]|uniref:hypothetical protein n=1 Tax=Mesorhizobium sp. B3-2-1 TaxID=2589891 RepID=UPI00112E5C18|nr:hypothetical protein [Mesorhizobium sp. B3-2-1]TPI27293.1 hypothetical protein FJW08_25110 [Mesorhizobium sp. B3-2-1]